MGTKPLVQISPAFLNAIIRVDCSEFNMPFGRTRIRTRRQQSRAIYPSYKGFKESEPLIKNLHLYLMYRDP